MTGHARTLTYPADGLGAPKNRHVGQPVDSGLPADVEVFSADDHISLAVDIFYERLPEEARTVSELSGSADAREGLAAVLERRAPKFSGS